MDSSTRLHVPSATLLVQRDGEPWWFPSVPRRRGWREPGAPSLIAEAAHLTVQVEPIAPGSLNEQLQVVLVVCFSRCSPAPGLGEDTRDRGASSVSTDE